MNDSKLQSLSLVSKSDTSETSPEGPKTFTFRASDGQPDRAGDRVFVSGWKLDAYKSNPVVLLNHNDGAPSLFSDADPVMPIGKANVYTQTDGLYADITFDVSDPLGQQAQSKVEGGFLNAVSVRFLPNEEKAAPNAFGGFDFQEQELLEISLVIVPCNQRAVRIKSHDDQIEALASRIAELIERKAFSAARPETVSETKAETSAPGMDLGKAADALAKAILNHLNPRK